MSDFCNTTTPKARKDHRCEWCAEVILKSERHVKNTGVWEGTWQNWRMHDECYEDASINDEMQDGFTPFEHERPAKVPEQTAV